jgi:hypothetical protein
MKNFSEIYKEHRLNCYAQTMSDGKYGARLIIQRDFRSEIQERSIGVEPSTYATEDEAINAARTAGRLWVDDQI